MDRITSAEVFVAIVERGSLSAAAEGLDMSRAMVTRYLAQMEAWSGARLLHRTTRRVSVSPEGAVYLERCKRILTELQAADDELKLARARPQGRLRVDVPVAFGKHLLLPALPRFTARYPEIALEVRFNDRYVDLAREGVDLACRVGPPRDPDLIARKVTTSRIVTCASPRYLSEHGIPRSPEELRKHRLIGYLRDSARPGEWQFKSGKGVRRLKLPMALAFNTAEPLTLSAMEGQGIVQQVDLLVAKAIADGRLVEILREYSCEGPVMNIVYPRATQHLAKVRVFAEFAAEIMRNYQARARFPATEA